MKKLLALVLALALVLSMACVVKAEDEKIKINVLIMPKFENGELYGDFPGEAQLYYEAYCMGGEEYDIVGGMPGEKLYVKDGVALYILGVGKLNAAMSTMAIFFDDRFDLSDCYVLSTGCAGSAYEYGVMGDVFVITAAIDLDLGHRADARELTDPEGLTFFYDPSYAEYGVKFLDAELTDKVYEMVKDIKLETTPKTRNFMAVTFDNAEWATRDPMVLRGTTVTADNYWKGYYDHMNAVMMTETFNCPDPYALTEMEDIAIANALNRLGMLDHYIIIRDSVNMDVFMNGATPESLWDPEFDTTLASEDNVEAADIFRTAMENNFKVGSVVINAILDGTF